MPSSDAIVLLNELVQLVSHSAELRTAREALELEQQKVDLQIIEALKQVKDATPLDSVHKTLAELEARYCKTDGVVRNIEDLP